MKIDGSDMRFSASSAGDIVAVAGVENASYPGPDQFITDGSEYTLPAGEMTANCRGGQAKTGMTDPGRRRLRGAGVLLAAVTRLLANHKYLK
jgi:hypothetical protein